MFDFNGKVVLVTGGGAGIGHATAKAFADLGASVVALEVDQARSQQLRSALGDRGLVVTGDATAAVDVSALADAIGSRYGRLDVLVNNVGHFMTRPTPFERLTDDQIDDNTASTSSTSSW
ncbi:SDR family NAD(P)-dependent oxidoreductase [Mycobacterium sp. E1386]|uniref:SDR family NAD(P)-dependent oxidoreductase n=1 Tax=Mycobacterium sp. E1386 TaxID=1834126 RepID=UPI000B2C55C0|nr:SDR family NAD(P)-dependent oxidoreductase [Mycobacterium sp. E1386]